MEVDDPSQRGWCSWGNIVELLAPPRTGHPTGCSVAAPGSFLAPTPRPGGGAEPLSLSLTLCPVGVGPIDLRACSLLPRYLGGKQGSCLNSQWSVRAGVATVQSVPAGEQLGQGRGFPGWVTGPGLQAPEPRLPVSKCTEDLPDLGNVCSVARPGPTGVS